MADVWFYATESACSRCKVVHFKDVQENGDHCNKNCHLGKTCMGMRTTVITIVIWEGESSGL